MKMQETLDPGSRGKASPEKGGVMSGISQNAMPFESERDYGDGAVSEDNAMNDGKNGFSRAVKKHTSGTTGSFPIDGGTK